jgi:cob(I)alamin adenosyltransferase
LAILDSLARISRDDAVPAATLRWRGDGETGKRWHMTKRITKITTKAGDEGYTGLLGPDRVSKDSPRIEACGEVDEATSAIGLARAGLGESGLAETLLGIQRDLYVLMSELASTPQVAERLPRRIGQADVERLEALQEEILAEAELPPEFIVPGGTIQGASLDLARAIVRRAERRIVGLARGGLIANPALLRYANRLSDVLFAMARLVETRAGRKSPLADPTP